jgi:hydroxypyruvate isomerase
MPRFDLNISITLKEQPFLERFDTAARLGFGAVEFWWPAGEDLSAIAARIKDAGLAVALFNFDGGSLAKGERGLLNDPSRQAELRASVPGALALAQQVGCPRLNALVGISLPNTPRDEQLAHARENLAWLCEQAAAAGVEVVVESLNSWESPNYLLTNTPDTLAFLDSVGAPNLQYQYDVYHMQRMEGNVVATIRREVGRIGHMQIADSPGRGQPGTGELNFPFILDAIDATGYTGFVGLEYVPQGTLEESLGWLPFEARGTAMRKPPF